MKPKLKAWLKGLAASIIIGSSTSVIAYIKDPLSFNLDNGLNRLITVSLVSGIFGAAAYLLQSPLPGKKIKK